MRFRISYVVDVDEEFLRSLRKLLGKAGIATLEEVEKHFRLFGLSKNTELAGEAYVVDGSHRKKRKTRRLPRVG